MGRVGAVVLVPAAGAVEEVGTSERVHGGRRWAAAAPPAAGGLGGSCGGGGGGGLRRPSPSSLLTRALRSGSGASGAAAALETAAPAAEAAAAPAGAHIDLGFERNLEALYDVGEVLGEGGNGVVRLVQHRASGQQFACKTLPKVLDAVPGKVSEGKALRHLVAVRNEIDVLRRLRGTLNVAHLKQVFEDDDSVHIVMEACRGGELLHTLGERHYSEQTVASVMRAVLRTLSQCHSHRILHLDIKPGNFMLLDETETAPVKAIDFGLARPFRPEDLPLTDVGLEGTPWYMAPEMLRSEVTPAVDVWAAGVMAYQMLVGRFPFDDRKRPFSPSVNVIWRSVLCDEPDFQSSIWEGVSEDAKDFVRVLLNKEPEERPTAKQALTHPWLQGHDITDRHSKASKSLRDSVVQRIQRYGQSSVVKRTLLEMLVAEMLQGVKDGPCQGESCPPDASTITTPECNLALKALVQHLSRNGTTCHVDYHEMEKLLVRLGYRLKPEELEQLLQVVDMGQTGCLSVHGFVASQMDWPAVQRHNTDTFQEAAMRIFQTLDMNGDGEITAGDLSNMLVNNLPSSEVTHALEDAEEEARCAVEECSTSTVGRGMDFNGFLRYLHHSSSDSLNELAQYDDKLSSCASSASMDGLLSSLEKSIKDGSLHNSAQWKELEKSVREGNLHNSAQWKELEKSVKGGNGGLLGTLFGSRSNSGSIKC